MRIRLAVLLACVAGAATHAFAQGCPPNSQAPIAQSPNNTNVAPPSVTFTWTASTASGVTGYEVHAGMTVGSAGTVCNASGASATSCTASSAA